MISRWTNKQGTGTIRYFEFVIRYGTGSRRIAAITARLNHGAVSSRQHNETGRSEYAEDGLCS